MFIFKRRRLTITLASTLALGLGVSGMVLAGVLGHTPIAHASSGTWSATGSMSVARWDHTATLLPTGRVLVAGGTDLPTSAGASLASAELYDPATGTWSATGPMSEGRLQHTATLLPTGKVLVAGDRQGARCRGTEPWRRHFYQPGLGGAL